jgi:16S rRNA (adenine1518-N6/adenine1519-N6)-dimethyltransferase
MNTNEIKKYLTQNTWAKKSLGQHFLTSPEVVRRMAKAAQIDKNDLILEIGPGLGILTEELLRSPAKEVILVEKDRQLCEKLKGDFTQNRVKIICDDALLIIPNLQVDSPFKVISNLPYNIGAPTLISLLTICPTLPEKIIVMLQKEVAERITTKPGDSNRGLLTVLIELYGQASILEKVPRNLFYPVPQVDSAVLFIDKIEQIPFEPKAVIRILKLCFAGKRKKLKNSLFASLQIPSDKITEITYKAGISADQRPEQLSREDWAKLIEALLEYRP